MTPSAHNYKLTIAYDGTHYSGWQVQPNGVSIQEVIQKNLAIILRNDVTVIASGRTDAGVHAVAQIANFHFPQTIDLRRLQFSLNGMLPNDIRIMDITEVPLDFHAQYSALGKIYHYHLCLENIQEPFRRLYCLHVKEKINLELLKESAALFIGTHDFTSFANEAHLGSAARDPVRTLRRLDVVTQPDGVRLEFEADGFLYKMIRNTVGTLLEVASNKRPKEDINAIFAAKDRRLAGKAAPPQGLFLMHVNY